MEMDYKALGKRIKIARIKKGITQESIANEIDITPSHLSNVETGKTKVSLPTLIDIANALSINIDALLCDNILNSKIVFEGEAKELFEDCDEYETRMLVDILKYMKEVIRTDRKVRDQFSR
ncbi:MULTISPECIES: helix-turn-helix domain-containing protein [unclassified Clostridioides]|nr:helix-turn-helix transcriptional regulator [Clostridioides sp. ES-S-0145-01]MCC0681856.1 helix-turn-helix transcriptional regulator [Clostridioides sp. ES-S-0005-03]MCC0709394.1 helix-turn-helix transcriptional regulator [Clostridioides sp. ES-S-0190-01]UDN64053.1 helix-turn-helix transcriptional regulator [Clostridioides sp. ES-W-0016-02]